MTRFSKFMPYNSIKSPNRFFSYLRNVSYDDVSDLNLFGLPSPDDAECLLPFDPVLQSPELLFLRPVIEGRHQNHDDDGDQDGGALDPLVVVILWKYSHKVNTRKYCHKVNRKKTFMVPYILQLSRFRQF